MRFCPDRGPSDRNSETDDTELGERIGLMTTVEVPERSQDRGTFGRSLKTDDVRRVGINWYGLQNCGTNRAP